MRARWLAGRSLRTLLAPLVITTVLIVPGPGTASASARGHWTGVQPPSPGSANNILNGAAVVSPHRAWAVGWYSNVAGARSANTLIELWDGFSWKRQASPNPGGRFGQDYLFGVAATSPADAWAVGKWANGQGASTLIEHWDGTSWTHVPSPNPGVVYYGNVLEGVAATSPADAWAVGTYYDASFTEKTLIEHWDGTAWRHVPSPGPDDICGSLTAVAATSSTNAWAVGFSAGGRTLIEHWNGTRWKLAPSPSGGDRKNSLSAVTATSAANAWTVGQTCTPTGACRTLILHWDGSTWKRVPSPSASQLYGVIAISPANAWAVGYYRNNTTGAYDTLILHWDGTAWSKVTSPNLTPANIHVLNAVSAASAANIWAVGEYANPTSQHTLAAHCC